MPRWRLEESCARTWSPVSDGDLDAGLARATAGCTAGLSPLREGPFEVVVEPGRAVQLPFSIPGPSACLRVVAVSSVDRVDVSVWKGSELIAGASSTSRVVAAPVEGLVCVLGPADLRLEIERPAGSATPSGRVAANIWFTRGE